MNLRWALTEVMLEVFEVEDVYGPALVWLSRPFSTALTIGYGRLLSARIPSPWE